MQINPRFLGRQNVPGDDERHQAGSLRRVRLTTGDETCFFAGYNLQRSLFLGVFTLLLVSANALGQPDPEVSERSATERTRSTETRSADFRTDAEKLAFLDQYLVFHSAVEATEFFIVYRDNSTGLVPGPSDWDIRAVLKLDRADVPRWTGGMQQVAADSVDLSWGYALLSDEPRWQISSQPAVYRSPGAILAVFEPEGVVFARRSTM